MPEGEPPAEGSFSPWENTSKIINDVMEKNGEKNFESQNKSIVFNKKNKELEGKDFKTAIGSLSYWTASDGATIFTTMLCIPEWWQDFSSRGTGVGMADFEYILIGKNSGLVLSIDTITLTRTITKWK